MLTKAEADSIGAKIAELNNNPPANPHTFFHIKDFLPEAIKNPLNNLRDCNGTKTL
jgi:hypothetical protein